MMSSFEVAEHMQDFLDDGKVCNSAMAEYYVMMIHEFEDTEHNIFIGQRFDDENKEIVEAMAKFFANLMTNMFADMVNNSGFSLASAHELALSAAYSAREAMDKLDAYLPVE